jgi:hypothetical protein
VNNVKWFTQRVTGLIFWPIVVVGIPFLLAKLGQIVGLWSSIDSLYTSLPWVFWIALVATRIGFSAAWVYSGMKLGQWGKAAEFFWFAEDRSYHSSRPEPVDQSSWILTILMLTVAAAFFGEIAIRLVTWTAPFYLPPSH